MISRTGRYALHILGFLVSRRDELVRAETIADATGIPANYLSKILNQLRKNGIAESRKGWHGGFRLLPAAIDRPIRDVLAAIDGIDSVDRSDCVFGLPRCDDQAPCPLHGYWEQIRTTYDAMLTSSRIRDLEVGRLR